MHFIIKLGLKYANRIINYPQQVFFAPPFNKINKCCSLTQCVRSHVLVFKGFFDYLVQYLIEIGLAQGLPEGLET